MSNDVMLVLSDNKDLGDWITFAKRLLPANGELLLRGMIAVEADKSLSEGAMAAREWRKAFHAVTLDQAFIHDEALVIVDYQPFQRILNELKTRSIHLLLVEWDRLNDTIGGVPFEQILMSPSYDVALAIGVGAITESHPVLLSLRGGPNLSIGTRIASALAGEKGTVTLFHAVDKGRAAVDLEVVMRSVPRIGRTVTAVSSIVDGIVRESLAHDIIVMGASLSQSRPRSTSRNNILSAVAERTRKPIVVVHTAEQESAEFHVPNLFTPEDDTLSIRVDRWFAENTFHSSEFDNLDTLLDLKARQGIRISVVLPTLNEAKTVERVIRTIKDTLMDQVPLIDEIVLIDSNSSDDTVAIAKACGIPTVIHQEVLVDEVGSFSGKGEALWKSLHVTHGDIIAWIDTDITNIHPRFIYGLLGPLLKYPHLQFVKGFYTRPLNVGNGLQAYGGGRVTELVARPLLNLFYPELSGIIQPLSGEYAGRRQVLEQLPFFSGYGVETGLLIDIFSRFGLHSLAQCDLEVRVHHNQPLTNLSKMSFAILQVFFARLESRYGGDLLNHANRSMKLVVQEAERFALDIIEIGDHERIPMIDVAPYRSKHPS
ncbi:MAG: glucosyl-3-phosphoglycerate synthase [Chloroflexota bacterium]|nr:glucosyl-3-phosphoglycerate synthase [Chloroflexota bacterium]